MGVAKLCYTAVMMLAVDGCWLGQLSFRVCDKPLIVEEYHCIYTREMPTIFRLLLCVVISGMHEIQLRAYVEG